MKETEHTGRTVEEAIAAALNVLGAERDDVEVEVLAESTRGLLGIFGQTEARVRVTLKNTVGEKATALAEEMLSLLEISAQVSLAREDAESAEVEIDAGEDTGLIIGKRGETLGALQHLVALLANKGRATKKRVLLNAGGYLERREQALSMLAERTSQKVRATGRSITLEALSPRERRIIHVALANEPGITTSSIGVDPNRCVIVSPSRSQYAPRPPEPSPDPGASKDEDPFPAEKSAAPDDESSASEG